MQEYLKNWKFLAALCVVLVGAGFALGRGTAGGPKTVVRTETVEVIKEVEKRVIVEVEKKVDKVVSRAPTKTVTKKFDPAGKVTEETVVDSGVVVEEEKATEVKKEVSEEKSSEQSKIAIGEKTVTESRDWLIGGGMTYSLQDVVESQYTRPEISLKAGYRLFSGVYPGLGVGFDTGTGRMKVGLHLDVAF